MTICENTSHIFIFIHILFLDTIAVPPTGYNDSNSDGDIHHNTDLPSKLNGTRYSLSLSPTSNDGSSKDGVTENPYYGRDDSITVVNNAFEINDAIQNAAIL